MHPPTLFFILKVFWFFCFPCLPYNVIVRNSAELERDELSGVGVID